MLPINTLIDLERDVFMKTSDNHKVCRVPVSDRLNQNPWGREAIKRRH